MGTDSLTGWGRDGKRAIHATNGATRHHWVAMYRMPSPFSRARRRAHVRTQCGRRHVVAFAECSTWPGSAAKCMRKREDFDKCICWGRGRRGADVGMYWHSVCERCTVWLNGRGATAGCGVKFTAHRRRGRKIALTMRLNRLCHDRETFQTWVGDEYGAEMRG